MYAVLVDWFVIWFDKIAGSDFEHQRLLLMARRADHKDVICNPSRRAIRIKAILVRY